MKCPKCGYEQIAAETCADCGIIISKYYEARKRKTAPSAPEENPDKKSPIEDETPEEFPFLEKPAESGIAALLSPLINAYSLPWNPVSKPMAGFVSILFAVLIYLLATKGVFVSPDESFILYLLHEANLVFHEAGHVIFGLFGNTIGILGGSMGQILIPLVVAGHFWFRRDAAGFAFGMLWCFENFLDVAVYIGDSRALVLPLIGGLGYEAHDWRNLLLDSGLLHKDTLIAGYVNAAGWAGILSTWAWFTWRWLSGKKDDTGFQLFSQ